MMNTRTVSGASFGLTIGRVISLATAGAAENMAIDQAILDSVTRTGVPVLRFYQWAQPTLSLGYFQRLAARSAHAQSEPVGCVRRTTGGGAIVHDRELTYSLTIPVPAGAAGPRSVLYQQTHASIADALADFGIHAVPFCRTGVEPRLESQNSQFLCFQRRTAEDLIVSGYKVLGSAQRKSRSAVLQHGSLLLCTSLYAPQLPGINDLLSTPVTAEQLVPQIVENLSESLGVEWREGSLSNQEIIDADQICRERFDSSLWTARR
ncbi:MAG: lipoate--protein ligase family protein [Rubripirellula sp.]|jgi:lipoate-protein ligase A